MALTLTSDPILSREDVREILDEANDTRAIVLINSVSARFLSYTNRLRITVPSSDLVELLQGNGMTELFVHASPITATTSIKILANGDVQETLTAADYEVYATAGCYHRNSSTWPLNDTGERDVEITYRGGWAAGSIPGDIIEGAIAQMRAERQRLSGTGMVTSMSRGGESVQYEQPAGLLAGVKEAWNPYRILV